MIQRILGVLPGSGTEVLAVMKLGKGCQLGHIFGTDKFGSKLRIFSEKWDVGMWQTDDS